MKFLQITTCLFFSFNCFSQTKTFNTKIEKATNVKITSGKAEIKNVENLTVGTIILSNVKPKYFFDRLERQQDSLSIYTNTIYLIHSGEYENTVVKLALTFDKPVNSVECYFGVSFNTNIQFAYDKTWFKFEGVVQASPKFATIVITSNTPVSFQLSGVDAKQN